MDKTPNELLMEQYEEDRLEKLEELKARKDKKMSRRGKRSNRHPWESKGSDE